MPRIKLEPFSFIASKAIDNGRRNIAAGAKVSGEFEAAEVAELKKLGAVECSDEAPAKPKRTYKKPEAKAEPKAEAKEG